MLQSASLCVPVVQTYQNYHLQILPLYCNSLFDVYVGSAENMSWHESASWGGASLQLHLEVSFWPQEYFGFSFAAGDEYSTQAGTAGLTDCSAAVPSPRSLLEEGENAGIPLRNLARTKFIHWHWVWLDATI